MQVHRHCQSCSHFGEPRSASGGLWQVLKQLKQRRNRLTMAATRLTGEQLLKMPSTHNAYQAPKSVQYNKVFTDKDKAFTDRTTTSAKMTLWWRDEVKTREVQHARSSHPGKVGASQKLQALIRARLPSCVLPIAADGSRRQLTLLQTLCCQLRVLLGFFFYKPSSLSVERFCTQFEPLSLLSERWLGRFLSRPTGSVGTWLPATPTQVYGVSARLLRPA